MRRVPIDTVGKFYTNTNPDGCCSVCKGHKIVIVQRFSTYYAMHTWMATPPSGSFYIHTWSRREDDPHCLRCFEPTDHPASRRASFTNLSQALSSRQAGVDNEVVDRLLNEMPPVPRRFGIGRQPGVVRRVNLNLE